MLREIGQNVVELGVLGFLFGLVGVLIKPFTSFKKSIQDILSSIIVSVIVGLLLDYTTLSVAVKSGIIGFCGLYAPCIYTGIWKLAYNFSQNPQRCITKVANKWKKTLKS